MKMSTRTVENPKVVSREEWLVARKKLLAKEKQLNHRLPEAALASDPRATAEWDLRAETGEAGGNPQAGRRGTKAWYPDGAGSFDPTGGDAGSAAAVGLDVL